MSDLGFKIISEELNDIELEIGVKSTDYASMKKAIWLYFLLLIFEGALRKWIFPAFATPLILVRDPIALWLIFKAIQHRLLQANIYLLLAWIISFLSFYMTLFFGHGDATVAIYGVRILGLHFPLIFIIGKIFEKDDVIKIGEVVLYLNVFMTVLVAVQFFSPQTAWVNRGIGGNMEGSGFSATAEYFRVPGTFSFTNGLSLFYGLVAAYVFYFWLDQKNNVPKILLILSTLSLLAAIPLSVSRTVFFEVAVTGVFSIAASGRRPKLLMRILGSILIGGILFWLLNNLSFYQVATGAFTERFNSANNAEGGVEGVFIDRFLGGMIDAINNDQNIEFWGKGLGFGTNAGAKLAVGDVHFFISEGEWGRLIGEMGILLGFTAILLRVGLTLSLCNSTWKAIAENNYLPWLILSFGAILILQGQWGQPTALGFGTLSGGLILGSLNSKS